METIWLEFSRSESTLKLFLWNPIKHSKNNKHFRSICSAEHTGHHRAENSNAQTQNKNEPKHTFHIVVRQTVVSWQIIMVESVRRVIDVLKVLHFPAKTFPISNHSQCSRQVHAVNIYVVLSRKIHNISYQRTKRSDFFSTRVYFRLISIFPKKNRTFKSGPVSWTVFEASKCWIVLKRERSVLLGVSHFQQHSDGATSVSREFSNLFPTVWWFWSCRWFGNFDSNDFWNTGRRKIYIPI